MQISDNEYWIGTETGIYIYHANDRSIIRLKKEYDNSYSISDNVVLTFCKDREGGLWIGTYFGGLDYYPKQFTTFNKYFPEYTKPSIVGNAIHEICKDHSGQLWVGTEDGGLNKIDLNRKYIYFLQAHWALQPALPITIFMDCLHPATVLDWNIYARPGYHEYQNRQIIRHYNAGTGPHDLKNNFIVTIFKTHSGDIFDRHAKWLIQI